MKLEIRGSYQPCTSVNGGCDMALQATAARTGAEIVYTTTNGAVRHYPEGEFVEDSADGPEMRTLPPEVHTLKPEQEADAIKVRKQAFDKTYSSALENANKQGFTKVTGNETKLSDVARRLGVKTKAVREANPDVKEPLKAGEAIALPAEAIARAQAKDAADRALREWVRTHITGSH
jgi:hypothetical protein